MLRTASIAEFEEMILNGTIGDGCTLAAWGLYKLWKERDAFAEGTQRMDRRK